MVTDLGTSTRNHLGGQILSKLTTPVQATTIRVGKTGQSEIGASVSIKDLANIVRSARSMVILLGNVEYPQPPLNHMEAAFTVEEKTTGGPTAQNSIS